MKGGSSLRAKITFSKNLSELEQIMKDGYGLSNS